MSLLFWIIVLSPIVIFFVVYVMTNPTSEIYLPQISIPVSKIKLYETVSSLTRLSKPRNYTNVDALDEAAEIIRQSFEKTGGNVTIQEYQFSDSTYRNVICSFGPSQADRVIVGAHYDVCEDQPGADDNASGVAGIIELARLLGKLKPRLKYRIDLIAYTLEEPPFFKTGHMGSDVHARSLSDNGIPVKEMISLEMIGYFTQEENSQSYPLAPLKLCYPSVGNYISIVGNLGNWGLVRRCKNFMTQACSVDVFSINAPSFIRGVGLSDHQSYWKYGFPAIMITDTAFYRNKNYHRPSDTIETLNFDGMAEVIKGVYWYITQRSQLVVTPPPAKEA